MAEDQFNIDVPDLHGFLDRVRSYDTKLATAVRRQLRESGDSIIAAQRAILAEKPGTVTRVGKRWRLVTSRHGAPQLVLRDVYRIGPSSSGGVGDLRARISQGLRTRVTAGKTRQSVSIVTTGPRNDGYNMARVWQKRRFRHPVFGHGWVWQAGNPYFYGPLKTEYADARKRIQTIVEETLERLAHQ